MTGSVTAIDLPAIGASQPKYSADDHGNERPQDQDEAALGDEIGLARLVNQLGHFEHRRVHRQILELHVRGQAEEQAERAHQQPPHQQLAAVDAPEFRARHVGQHQVHLAARTLGGGPGSRLDRLRRSHHAARRPEDPAHQDDQHQRERRLPRTLHCLHDRAHGTSSTATLRRAGRHRATSPCGRSVDMHKDSDYTRKSPRSASFSRPTVPRTREGIAMPPVRKILMPSSTVRSGNVVRSRSQITMSPR